MKVAIVSFIPKIDFLGEWNKRLTDTHLGSSTHCFSCQALALGIQIIGAKLCSYILLESRVIYRWQQISSIEFLQTKATQDFSISQRTHQKKEWWTKKVPQNFTMHL